MRVADEPGVCDRVDAVGHDPHEVVDVVDLRQIVHQCWAGDSGCHKSPVQRLVGEVDVTVHGALTVAGQYRAEHQFGAVAKPERYRRDERGQTLANRADEPLHDARNVYHPGERVAVADPASQRFGCRNGRGPRDVAQEGNLADDHPGHHLLDDHDVVVADVLDLSSTGRDEQEGKGPLTLPHEHLAGGGVQGQKTRGQWHQIRCRTSFEDVHSGEFIGAQADQFGHWETLDNSHMPATRRDRIAMNVTPWSRFNATQVMASSRAPARTRQEPPGVRQKRGARQTPGMDIGDDPLERTRGLLETTASVRHGFLDVLGASMSSPVPTLAQRAMNSPFVAAVYERMWRPVSFYLASGITTRAEQRRACEALRISGSKKLLDIACGPGNFTAELAKRLSAGGLAVGFDISEPMLTRAVLDNSGPRTCYLRGDAHHLPFGDETFDAVCCFGALYLMPEPFQVANEMVRVLKPGGRAAILTTCALGEPPIRRAMAVGASLIGLRMFERSAFVDLFSSAGLVDIEQHTQRALQFVAAGKLA